MYQLSRNLALLCCLIFMLVACGTSAPTVSAETDSSLIALAGEDRTVSGNDLMIMGAVSEGNTLSALSYTLGDGEAQDVSASIDGATFSFNVSGLVKGENTIVITATSGKKKHTLELSVISLAQTTNPGSGTLVDLEGMWVADDSVDMRVCNSIADADLTFIFDAVEPNGSVGGLWHLVSSYETRLGAFNGNLDTEGAFSGSAVLIENDKSLSFDLEFKVLDDKLDLDLAAIQDSYCDDYGYEDEETKRNGFRETYEAKLERFEDDALEPNSVQETASVVESGFAKTLVLASGDVDWFSFKMSEPSIATFKFSLEDSENYSGPRLELYQEKDGVLNQIRQLSTSGYENSIGLNTGQYFLKAYAPRLRHYSYVLNFDASELPDKAFEPNDTKAKASPLKIGVRGDYYLSQDDKDYYRFTLSTAKLVTMSSDNLDMSIQYAILSEAQQEASASFKDFYQESTRTLSAGTYYVLIRAGFEDVSSPYNFTVTLADAPDANLEPNNNAPTASAITLPFRQDIHLSPEDEDWFAFTLSEEQFVHFDAQNWETPQVGFHTASGRELFNTSGNKGSGRILEAGDYKVRLHTYFFDTGYLYDFYLNTTALSDAGDDNHSKENAKTISLGYTVKNLGVSERAEDWYTFTLENSTTLNLDFGRGYPYNSLTDESGSAIESDGEDENGELYTLNAGTYYLRVYSYSTYGSLYDLNLNPHETDNGEDSEQG